MLVDDVSGDAFLAPAEHRSNEGEATSHGLSSASRGEIVEIRRSSSGIAGIVDGLKARGPSIRIVRSPSR